MNSLPLISIITPSYNSGEFLEETIQSVLQQTYPHIEYIVMDGGSTDNTLEILQKYQDQIRYVSEADKGQSDAINKGWKHSKGSIVAWLCADDLYLPKTVETVVKALRQSPEFMWSYGHARHIDKEGNRFPFRNPTFDWNYQSLLDYGNYIIQPTVFLKREILDIIGYVREDLHYSMDYEYWLRIGQKFPALHIPNQLAIVRYYAENKSASGGIKRLNELQQLTADFGASEIPKSFRHDWTRIYFNQGVFQLFLGNLQQAVAMFKSAGRYPNHLPRAWAKNILNALPPNTSRQLRQILMVRKHT